MKDEIMLNNAKILCRIAHESIGQKRKYTGKPYYHHPYNVVKILNRYKINHGKNTCILCVAYLHDMIEDVFPINQYFGVELLKEIFGTDSFGIELVNCVLELTTDDKILFPGNRKERHEQKLAHYSKISNTASIVKLADIMDNCSSIVEHDKNFAKIYIPECIQIAKVLRNNLYEDLNYYDEVNLYKDCMLTLYEAKDAIEQEGD